MPTKKTPATPKRAAKRATVAAAPEPRSDNEKAMLVALAYLIGFVTAYIAFVLNYPAPGVELAARGDTSEPVVVGHVAAGSAIRAFTTEEGLFVSHHGADRIVSARSDEDASVPGYHRQIALAAVSPDGNFVHYCALMTAADDRCSHFIYAVDTDTVTRVRTADIPLDTSVAEAKTAVWNSDGSLTIGVWTSRSTVMPWIGE